MRFSNEEVLQNGSAADSWLSLNGRKTLPLILQTEVAECGLACLAMVAGYYGYESSITSLRSRFPIYERGTNLKQIMRMAYLLGFTARAVRAEPEQLRALTTPCIIHWEMNHFVVLKKIYRNRFTIHDPAIGERQIGAKEFNLGFTGVALELFPNKEFQTRKEDQRLKVWSLWHKSLGLKRSLVLIIALSLLLQLCYILAPFYMQIVVDEVILFGDRHLLTVLAFGFTLLLAIQAGTYLLREWIVLRLTSIIGLQMSANLFRHLIQLPMEYFRRRHIGDVVSRFGSINYVRETIAQSAVSAVVDGAMVLVTVIVMFVYSIKLTLIVIVFVAIYLALRLMLYSPLRRSTEEEIIASAKENSHFMETVRAIQTVKLFENESDRQSQWLSRMADKLNRGINRTKWEISYRVINQVVFGVENILLVYFGAWAVLDGGFSVGMLFAFFAYKLRFTSSVDELANQVVNLRMLSLHLERISDVVFSRSEPAHAGSSSNAVDDESRTGFGGMVFAEELRGEMEVINLSYKQNETESPVFENVSFKVRAGETVAITGASGCGKTTMIKCMMGLLKPSSGKILVDGSPINSMLNYRSNIAAVMQEDKLLSGSIYDNISFFDQSADQEKVISCAKMANIHEDIMAMPMRYNSLVGDMGDALSGGQRQRIFLARALYREPKILFMDEATSHLDTINESLVNDNIKKLQITRIIVAHRSDTIASAEREVRLGVIV